MLLSVTLLEPEVCMNGTICSLVLVLLFRSVGTRRERYLLFCVGWMFSVYCVGWEVGRYLQHGVLVLLCRLVGSHTMSVVHIGMNSPHEVLVVCCRLVGFGKWWQLIHTPGVLILLCNISLPPPPGHAGYYGSHGSTILGSIIY